MKGSAKVESRIIRYTRRYVAVFSLSTLCVHSNSVEIKKKKNCGDVSRSLLQEVYKKEKDLKNYML